MARDGLPANGSVGLELFGGNTLGMTEFTQKINYQRALEGELERTIGSLSAVQAVRVHIVTPEKTLLTSTQSPTTASIMVQLTPGKTLDQGQVAAITHLTASSIEGLKPENVVIVDSSGRMLASGAGSTGDASVVGQTDSRRAAESAVAVSIQNKAEILLAQVLGPNRAVVQADVTLDWTQKETTSQNVEPTPAAIRSSQKTTEDYSTVGSTTGGVPGASTNLPTPVATTTAGGSSSNYTRTDEVINYELSTSQTHEIISPGQIKRISLSVLVDNVTDAQQLETLKSAVAAAAGIDETRGDKLVVENTVFDTSFATEQQEELSKSSNTEMYYQIAQIAGAVILLFLLLWYVQRLLKNLRLASSEAWVPVMRPLSESALPSPSSQLLSSNNSGPMHQQVLSQPRQEPMFKLEQHHPEDEQLQKVLTRMTEDNPASVAEIIQLWLTQDEK
jgi:flagellar M-ring protein FliF